jgi:phosphatidylserine/phosphatidylglycerophosphate/cardiolipin synthase-like enzyme
MNCRLHRPWASCLGDDLVTMRANSSVRPCPGQAYSLTSAPIAKALVEANSRGAKVIVISDATNRDAKYSAADFLAHEGVETYIDSQHAIAHNKIIVIDGVTVLTGSFNFTKAAQVNNAENLLVIRDAKTAAQYEKNWQAHDLADRIMVTPDQRWKAPD